MFVMLHVALPLPWTSRAIHIQVRGIWKTSKESVDAKERQFCFFAHLLTVINLEMSEADGSFSPGLCGGNIRKHRRFLSKNINAHISAGLAFPEPSSLWMFYTVICFYSPGASQGCFISHERKTFGYLVSTYIRLCSLGTEVWWDYPWPMTSFCNSSGETKTIEEVWWMTAVAQDIGAGNSNYGQTASDAKFLTA